MNFSHAFQLEGIKWSVMMVNQPDWWLAPWLWTSQSQYCMSTTNTFKIKCYFHTGEAWTQIISLSWMSLKFGFETVTNIIFNNQWCQIIPIFYIDVHVDWTVSQGDWWQIIQDWSVKTASIRAYTDLFCHHDQSTLQAVLKQE